jgi:hypothetical protein
MNNQNKIHMAALIIWAGLLIDIIDPIFFKKKVQCLVRITILENDRLMWRPHTFKIPVSKHGLVSQGKVDKPIYVSNLT